MMDIVSRSRIALRGIAVVAIIAASFTACDEGEPQLAPGEIQLTEELRIDGTVEDFPVIGRPIVGPKGEIIIPMPREAQFRIYDSTGKRIATVGRKGEAPGEFEYLSLLGLKADTIWAQDAGNYRFTYFTPRGELIRVGPRLPGKLAEMRGFDMSAPYRFLIAFGIHPDGSMLAEGRRNAPRGSGLSRSEIVHITPDGEITSIAVPPSYEDERWMMEVAGLGRGIPFAGGPLSAHTFDAKYFGNTMTNLTSNSGGVYTVSLFRSNGDTVFTKEFQFVGVPIPQSAKDSAANAEIQPGGSSEGPADLDQRFRKLALQKMPPVYAPLQSMLIGLDGTTWLTLRDSGDVRATIVLDTTGNVLGRVQLSTRERIRQATATRIWVTQLDSNDLASVVRYRVRGLGRTGDR